MMLPHIKYSDGIVKQIQSRFRGYNHSLYASDGDIYDMKNITSEHFPLISQRNKRIKMPKPNIKLWSGTGFSFPDENTVSFPCNVDITGEVVMNDKVRLYCQGEKYFKIDKELTVAGLSYDEKTYTATITFFETELSTGEEILKNDILDIIIVEKNGNREVLEELGNIKAFGCGDKMYFVMASEQSNGFYYDGVYKGAFTEMSEMEDIRFVETGAYLYILPSGYYYNKNSGELVGNLNIEFTQGYGGIITTDANALNIPSDEFLDTGIKAGDTLSVVIQYENLTRNVFRSTVTYCQYDDRNSVTKIVFSEDIFKDIVFDHGSFSRVTVSKAIPDLKHICATANRIWGCDEKTIYCTRFGYPDDWFYYPASDSGNIADSSWSIMPFSDNGEFTGCIVSNGYPVFFKEDRIYKVYGDNASNFQLVETEQAGVLKGSEKSLVNIGNSVLYLSPKGVMEYSNNSVTSLTENFFEVFENGCAGTDGDRYYISMQGEDERKLFCYDMKKRLWTKEDNLEITDFLRYENDLYSLDKEMNLWKIKTRDNSLKYSLSDKDGTREDDFDSFIEFGDYYCQSMNKKGLSKLFLRLTIDEESEVKVLINYDSEKDESKKRLWKDIKTISTTRKKSLILPIIPRRCDHFRIKIEGKGSYMLYSVSYEYYNGSEI